MGAIKFGPRAGAIAVVTFLRANRVEERPVSGGEVLLKWQEGGIGAQPQCDALSGEAPISPTNMVSDRFSDNNNNNTYSCWDHSYSSSLCVGGQGL